MTGQTDIVVMPTGLADRRSGRVYVTGANGVVESLDVTDGRVVATSEHPLRPLTIVDDVLVGWSGSPADGVSLVGLALRGASLDVVWERSIELPDAVAPTVSDDDAFRIAAVADGTAHAVVAWEARARYAGGAPPPADVEAAAIGDHRGATRVDIGDGTTSDRSVDANALRSDEVEPLVPADSTDSHPMSYRFDGGRRTAPWRVGGMARQLVAHPGRSGFALRRDRKTPDEVTLSADARADVVVSLDGRHLLVNEPSVDSSVWRVLDADDATSVVAIRLDGELVSAVEMADVVIADVRRVVDGVTHRTLMGYNAVSGELIWTLIVEKTAIRQAPPLRP